VTQPLVPIVMGHNAFFGVDHLSASRGAAKAASFADPERILEIIREGRVLGAAGMMMSTHERAASLAALIRSDPDLAQGLAIYPLLPYAQKYITKANEMGMVNVVLDSLKGTSLAGKMSFFLQGSRGVLGRDVNSVLSALVRLELAPFRDLDVRAVFLHDAFTDLALGLGLRDIFDFYMAEIDRSHGAVGAFATKNLPMLLERFDAWDLPTPTVMTHVNAAGFHMNPSRASCEEALAARSAHVMAMGTLASGFLAPDEAYRYLGSVPGIESVVVGVSSRGHAEQTFASIRRHMPELADGQGLRSAS